MVKRGVEDVYELSLKVQLSDKGNIEILKRLFNRLGVADQSIAECEQWPFKRLSVYYESDQKAREAHKTLRAYKLKNVRLDLKRLATKDWLTKWKDEFKPFSLTKIFAVVPTWEKAKEQFRGRQPIYINTDLAFGTGLHPTTRYMAQFVERCRGRYKSFLDVGTGTGILAIIAAKCGAENIYAVDISPEAVKVAAQNFKQNQCSFIHIRIKDARKLTSKKQYDFVCANIITQDLIGMARGLIQLVKSGKYLALSGISAQSYDTFRKTFDRHPLRCVKIEKGEGWVAILYQKL